MKKIVSILLIYMLTIGLYADQIVIEWTESKRVVDVEGHYETRRVIIGYRDNYGTGERVPIYGDREVWVPTTYRTINEDKSETVEDNTGDIDTALGNVEGSIPGDLDNPDTYDDELGNVPGTNPDGKSGDGLSSEAQGESGDSTDAMDGTNNNPGAKDYENQSNEESGNAGENNDTVDDHTSDSERDLGSSISGGDDTEDSTDANNRAIGDSGDQQESSSNIVETDISAGEGDIGDISAAHSSRETEADDIKEAGAQTAESEGENQVADNVGDPANIVTGANEFSVTDFSYNDIKSSIYIKRDYVSDNNETTSFGKGWTFNYDTRILYGVELDYKDNLQDINQRIIDTNNIYNSLFNQTDGYYLLAKQKALESIATAEQAVVNSKAANQKALSELALAKQAYESSYLAVNHVDPETGKTALEIVDDSIVSINRAIEKATDAETFSINAINASRKAMDQYALDKASSKSIMDDVGREFNTAETLDSYKNSEGENIRYSIHKAIADLDAAQLVVNTATAKVEALEANPRVSSHSKVLLAREKVNKAQGDINTYRPKLVTALGLYAGNYTTASEKYSDAVGYWGREDAFCNNIDGTETLRLRWISDYKARLIKKRDGDPADPAFISLKKQKQDIIKKHNEAVLALANAESYYIVGFDKSLIPLDAEPDSYTNTSNGRQLYAERTLAEAKLRLDEANAYYEELIILELTKKAEMSDLIKGLDKQLDIIRDEYNLAEVNESRNQYNISNDYTVKQFNKNNQLTFYDSNGNATLYQLIAEPVYDSLVVLENGMTNFYPYGSELKRVSYDNGILILEELGSSGEKLHLNNDGTITVLYKDNIKNHFNIWGKLDRIEDKNGTIISFKYNGKKLISITDSHNRVTSFEYGGDKIITITDPLNRVYSYSYEGDYLTGYTNPNGSYYGYEYTDGIVTKKTTPNDGYTIFEYTISSDGISKLSKAIDRAGYSWITNYHPEEKYTVLSNRNQIETYYYYNDNKKTVEERYSDGTSVLKDYDITGNLIKETNRGGYSTEYLYDRNNNRTQIRYANGSEVNFEYDSYNNLIGITDPNGNETVLTYDFRHNLITKTYPNKSYESFTYYENGLLKTTRDRKGNITELSYDDYGNISSIIYPDNSIKLLTSDILGNVTSITDGNENTTEIKYDSTGNITEVINPDGSKSVNTYNESGDLVRRVDPLNNEYEIEYDNMKRVEKEIDPLGYVKKFTYTPEGDIETLTLSDKNSFIYKYDDNKRVVSSLQVDLDVLTLFTYDKLGNLKSKTDAEGRVWEYYYDELSRLVKIVDPYKAESLREYDFAGNMTYVTDFNGNKTSYTYNNMNQIVTVMDATGSTTSFKYDANGNVIYREDAENNFVKSKYDSRNRLIERNFNNERSINYTYDSASNISSVTDGNGNTVRYEYNYKGQVTKETNPLGDFKLFEYDANGNLKTYYDEENSKTSYKYDGLNRVVEIENSQGAKKSFEYNYMGKVTKVTDALGNQVLYRYDSMGRVTEVIDQLGEGTKFTYDKVGNRTSTVNALGETTRYTYDFNNRLTRTIDPLNTSYFYIYDSQGNLTKEIDSEGNEYTYIYNELNKLVEEINRLGDNKVFEYNNIGQLNKMIDFNGNSITYDFNMFGQIEKEIFPDGSLKVFQYDKNGNLLYAKNDSSSLTFKYDELNRIIETKDCITNDDIQNIYDKRGNRTGIKVNDNLTTRYNYDSLNNITRIVSGERDIEFQYDILGRETLRSSLDDITTYVYDAAGRVKSITHKDGHEVARAESYIYDALGRKIFSVDEIGSIAAYNYNQRGQLSSVSYTFDSDHLQVAKNELEGLDLNFNAKKLHKKLDRWKLTGNEKKVIKDAFYNIVPSWKYLNFNKKVWTEEFSYSSNGNRESKITPIASINYSYNKENMLTSIGNKSIEYDRNGNMILEQSGKNSVEYLYNYNNRMTSYKSDSVSVEYSYDSLGRRDRRVENSTHSDSTDSTYTYDNLTFNVLKERRNYVNNWNDILELDHYYKGSQVLGTKETRWYHSHETSYRHDSLGSIIGYEEYNVVRPIKYNAFGDTIHKWGQKENYFGYNGKTIDGITGLYNYGYRDYSPIKGRFTSVDPIKDGTNWYAYCSNDPINYIDPNGLALIVAGDLTYNEKNGQFAFTDGRSVKESTTIEIQRTEGHTKGHFKSDLTVEIDGIPVYGESVQSWADKQNVAKGDITLPAGTYEGTLLDQSPTYQDPIKLVNEDLGASKSDAYMIHPNQYTNIPGDTTSWVNTGYSRGCQTLAGKAESYQDFTETLQSAGYEFNGTDTIEVNIKDPAGYHTTTDGKEVKKNDGC